MEVKKARPPRVKPEVEMSPEHRRVVLDYVQDCVPVKHKTATHRALTGQMGKALALKMKCLQCCGYQREEVKLCTVVTCALYPVRPYADKDEGDTLDE